MAPTRGIARLAGYQRALATRERRTVEIRRRVLAQRAQRSVDTSVAARAWR
jgi:hypothetical protein